MMRKAQIKNDLCSIDLPRGKSQLPRDPDDCWILVYANIGMEGSADAETFLFYVCTLKRITRMVHHEGFELGRHLVLLERFDWRRVEEAIGAVCAECTGETWEEIASKLGIFGARETESCQDGISLSVACAATA